MAPRRRPAAAAAAPGAAAGRGCGRRGRRSRPRRGPWGLPVKSVEVCLLVDFWENNWKVGMFFQSWEKLILLVSLIFGRKMLGKSVEFLLFGSKQHGNGWDSRLFLFGGSFGWVEHQFFQHVWA